LRVRLLDDLDELALYVLLLTLDTGGLMTLAALVPVLFVMLLVVGVGVLGLGGMKWLHWLRLDDQLRLFGLFDRVFGGDQCEGLLLLVVVLWRLGDECGFDRRYRLLSFSLLLAKLDGLLDQVVE
jgi:hypothetical protein